MSSIRDFTFTSFFGAQSALSNRQSRRIGYATTLERSGDAIVMRHHGNVIITYTLGYITVTTCGWYSQSTARRIARFSPIHPFCHGRHWYAAINGVTTPFYDGLNIATETAS